MKKTTINRFLSAILILCISMSAFAISAFATEPRDASADVSAEVSRGNELGFGDFIDVEKYAKNAGYPGYDSLTVLRIDTPRVFDYDASGGGFKTNWAIDIYFYNPNRISFNSEYDPFADSYIKLDGFAYVKDGDDDEINNYSLGLSVPDDEFADWDGWNTFDDLFFKASIVGDYFDSFVHDPVYYVESIEIYDSSFEEYVINIDQTMELQGIDYKLDVTTPEYDLSTFFDVEEKDIKMQYSASDDGELTLAYLYEREYGTKDYALYIYLHNPSGYSFVSLGYSYQGVPVHATIQMSFGSTVITQPFTLVKSSDTMLKLKSIGAINVPTNLDIRDYYIGDINVRVRENNKNENHLIECQGHYEYSEEPLTDVEKRQFEYGYRSRSIYLGKDFCGDDANDVYEFLLFFDNANDFQLSTTSGPVECLVWNEEYGCYAASTGSSFFELIDEF